MSLLDDASLIVTPNGYKGGVTTGKLYSVKPTNGDGDMVVTRNTTSTRVDSSGLIQSVAFNAPRLDYPPLGGCPRILVEPQRKNEVTYSEEFDNILKWTPIFATISANATTAPDGTSTADKFIPTNVNSIHFLQQSGFPSNAYTFSVFAKAGGETTFSIWLFPAGNVRADFNLSTETYTLTNATSGNIEPYPNGWYRCSVYYSVATTTEVRIYGRAGGAFAGDNVKGIFLWGAQAEAGTTATSYIPTVAGTVTRNADVISKTGISSLIGQTEGTIFVEANLTANTDQRRIITVSDGTESQRIIFWTLGTTLYANFNGVGITIGTFPIFPISTAKMALAYTIAGGSTTYSIKLNNNTLITGTAAAAPSSLSAINLGANTYSLLQLNDRIKSVTLFKTALSGPQLTNLTAI